MKQKIEANEVPKDPIKEKRKFIDELLGKDYPMTSKILIDLEMEASKDDSAFLSVKKEKKLDFKDNVMQVL